MSLLGFTSTLNMRNEKMQNSVSTNSQLHHDPGGYCDFIFFEKLRNRCHFWGSPALSICGMKRSRKIASPPTRSFIMIRGIIATLFFSRNWEIDVTFGVHQHSRIFFEKLRNVTFGVHKHSQYGDEKISQNSVSTNSQLHHDPGGYCDFIFFEKLRNRCHFWGSQALSICGMKRSRKIASPPTRSFIMIRGIIATLFFSRNWEIDVTFGVHQHSQYAEWKDLAK